MDKKNKIIVISSVISLSVIAIFITLFNLPVSVTQVKDLEAYSKVTYKEFINAFEVEGKLEKVIVDEKELNENDLIDTEIGEVTFSLSNKLTKKDIILNLKSKDSIKPIVKVYYDEKEINKKSEIYKDEFKQEKIKILATDSRYDKNIDLSKEDNNGSIDMKVDTKDDKVKISYEVSDGSNIVKDSIEISLKEKEIAQNSNITTSEPSKQNTSKPSNNNKPSSPKKPLKSPNSNKKPISKEELTSIEDLFNTPGEQLILHTGEVINLDDFNSLDEILDYLVPVTGRSAGLQSDLRKHAIEAIATLRRAGDEKPISHNMQISSALDKVIPGSYDRPHISISDSYPHPSSQITIYQNLYADTDLTADIIDIILKSPDHLHIALTPNATEIGASVYMFNDRETVIMINIAWE